jgi:hypothetical protein
LASTGHDTKRHPQSHRWKLGLRLVYGDLKAQGQDAIDFFTDKRVVISRW